jgi:acyl-coenzyme A synthetase/AMP-(fatty) acid ligase
LRADPARAIPSLTRLLARERPEDEVVAWRSHPVAGDAALTWGAFRAAVSTLERRLAALPSGGVALYTADSFAFAVGLFGIWHAGRVAVCPPNGQPETLAALTEVVIAAVSDGPGPVPERPLIAPEAEGRTRAGALAPLSPDAPAVELFTSGTTGRGKAVPKSIAHLEREVQSLDAHLGERVGDAPVLGSASHQHLYGMLFRVLWPLASERPFHARTLLHAEELAPRVAARGACALVSVPAHLKRLAQRDGFAEIARSCRVVFSSGGPLDADTASRWRAAMGDAPTEIFGSTETGGVAWRRQDDLGASTPFTPFGGVRVSRDVDGRLRVHSPIASVGDLRSGFAMGDRVRILADGRFAVEGRADRVVKIGEKRVSLPDMEERLREHELVAAAALLPLERGGETRVAAAIVPSAAGRALLAAAGPRGVSQRLREALAREWDRVLLPRAFRFVEALPEDAQGKTTLDRLAVLFEADGEGEGAGGAGAGA